MTSSMRWLLAGFGLLLVAGFAIDRWIDLTPTWFHLALLVLLLVEGFGLLNYAVWQSIKSDTERHPPGDR